MYRYCCAWLVVFVLLAAEPVGAQGKLPSMLIRVPESTTTLFVAETSTARFYRIRRAGDTLLADGHFYMSIGQEGEGKEQSGDRRTPLGAYFVTEQLDTSRLHEKYGVTAFPLDYPNAWDERLGRDGDGIWLHGVDPNGGQRPKRDTDGCIALPNADLSALIPAFEENVTPVLVTREVDWVDAKDSSLLRTELESSVTLWAESKASGDLYSYLSLYDDDFLRGEMTKAEWSALVLQNEQRDVAAGEQLASASVSDLLLLAYPEENNLYLSRFRLAVRSKERERVSIVRLYWRRDEHGAFRIMTEDNG
jgi:murein L,D-transpeptidase YafK